MRERYRPEDWNIYAAQASDGDNAYGDSEMTASLLTNAILPVSQYFAYLEVGEAGQHDNPAMPNSALWGVYERLRSEGHLLAMRKVRAADPAEVF